MYVKTRLNAVSYEIQINFPEVVCHQLFRGTASELLVGTCYKTNLVILYNFDIEEALRKTINEISTKRFMLIGDFNYPDINLSLKQCRPSASQDCKL